MNPKADFEEKSSQPLLNRSPCTCMACSKLYIYVYGKNINLQIKINRT